MAQTNNIPGNTQHEDETDNLVQQESDDGISHSFGENPDDTLEDGEDDDDDQDSGYEESSEPPPYSIAEITNKILDFYKFLTTAHFDEADLRVPPPEGWSHTPDPDGDDPTTGKSHLVRSVLKHLPYFVSSSRSQVHFNSRITDFSDYAAQVEHIRFWDEYFEDCIPSDDSPNYPADILVIAEGYESYGQTFVLIPKTGQIFVEFIRGGGGNDLEDMATFFDDLRMKYETLALLFAPGREVLQPYSNTAPEGYFPEADHEISFEDAVAKVGSEDVFGNVTTIQYLRQIFRKHGWPKKFDRQAVMAEVKRLEEACEADSGNRWPRDNRCWSDD